MKIRIIDIPKAQVGGSMTIAPFGQVKELPLATTPKDNAEFIPIKDSRKTDIITGKKIGDKNNLSRNIDPGVVKQIISEARKAGIDPLTALAISFQESGLDKDRPFNLNPKVFGKPFGNASEGIKSLKSAFDYAKTLQKQRKIPEGEEFLLQGNNGYGRIKKGHLDLEGSQSIYGLPIPDEGINFKKTPLYGKRILDIRDNILKGNETIQQLLNESQSSYKYGGNTMKKKVRIMDIPTTMQTGGDIQETIGLPPNKKHLANIEAENGEVYQNNQGGFTKISDNAPSHEDGGVMINDAERVLEDTSMDRKDKHSKALKMSPGEVEQIFGFKPKQGVSHAKAFELAKKHFDGQRAKFNSAQKELNTQKIMDKFSIASSKQNFINREFVPDEQDIFDTLFSHQEAIKEVNNIPTGGTKNKYGGYRYKAQTGIDIYEGGKTPEGSTTPMGTSNKFNFEGGLDAYKKAWAPLIDLSKFNSVEDAQRATYKWLADNQPDIASNIWQTHGLTDKGKKMMNPSNPEYNPKFARTASKYFTSSGKLKSDVSLSPEVLKELEPAYTDNKLGVRAIAPNTDSNTIGEPGQQITNETLVQGNNPEIKTQPKKPTVNVNPRFINQPKNQFFEPTRWYDLAPGIMELVDSMGRDPELYNPIQMHQLKYKLLNPTAAIQANQADFNAAAQALGNENVGSGVASANLSNLVAQKYKANNQIMADYENRNSAITNQEIAYNTSVKDRQSLADAQSREKYYTDVLKGRDNQRLQKLQAIQDLSRVAQLKARQNRSGNLILKMTPAYDENGQYNGYQYVPVIPSENAGDGDFIPQRTTSKSTPKTRTTTTTKIGDKVVKTTTSK